MTDLIEAPGADSTQGTATTEALPPNDGDRPLAWAPYEPAPKKHRTGLWVGLAVGALVVAAGAASLTLIAPGTAIAGVPVGGLTPSAAADVVNSRLADLEITLTGDSGEQVVAASELGASIDAAALADEAFAAHPMWNVGSWVPAPIAGEIALDTEAAHETLRGLLPASYEDAVNAAVVFDADSAAYTVTPAVNGTGVDLDSLTDTIAAALADGASTVEYSGAPAEAPAAISDDDASGMAAELNTMLETIGFYVGDERTAPVDPAVAATWFNVVDDEGELRLDVDESAIQSAVDALPKQIDREPVAATSIVNSSGDVLQNVTEGVDGRKLGDVSGAAAAFAEQLKTGDARYALDVNTVAHETTALHRYIDVNLAEQRAYLYENDTLVNSYAISSGLPDTPTPTGEFTVFAHTYTTDMGCFEGAAYCTEDVPWNTWFAPDIAFHGAYWHNNFGQQMSHGCVNLPVDLAKFVYDWSPVGTEVSVHW